MAVGIAPPFAKGGVGDRCTTIIRRPLGFFAREECIKKCGYKQDIGPFIILLGLTRCVLDHILPLMKGELEGV